MASPLRVPLSPLAPGGVELDVKTSRYVCRVHRLGAGGRFVLFDPEAATEADAVVIDTEPQVRCDVGALRPGRVPRRSVTLVQGLGKGEKPEQVVRDATALSVTRLVLAETERSVAKWTERADAKRARLASVAVDAARQSGRGNVPEIIVAASLAEVRQSLSPQTVSVGLAPSASETLGATLAQVSPDVPLAVFIGPEGGFSDDELAALREFGCLLVSFGDLVLRTELATAAVLGAVLAASR